MVKRLIDLFAALALCAIIILTGHAFGRLQAQSTGGSPTCPSGYTWNSQANMCEASLNDCSLLYNASDCNTYTGCVWTNDYCSPSSSGSATYCPPGYVWDTASNTCKINCGYYTTMTACPTSACWWDTGSLQCRSITSSQTVTPPTRSNGAPTGAQPYTTTSVTISLNTDKASYCRYSTTSSSPYSQMTAQFETSNQTYHYKQITGLSNGSTVIIYVRCRSNDGGENSDDYPISFSISSSSSGGGGGSCQPGYVLNPATNVCEVNCNYFTNRSNCPTASCVWNLTIGTCTLPSSGSNTSSPPTRTGGAPSGTLPLSTTSTTITLTTDKPSSCHYATIPSTPFDQMTGFFSTGTSSTSSNYTSHRTTLNNLTNSQRVTIYVRCRSSDGGENTDDYPISFAVASPSTSTNSNTNTQTVTNPPSEPTTIGRNPSNGDERTYSSVSSDGLVSASLEWNPWIATNPPATYYLEVYQRSTTNTGTDVCSNTSALVDQRLVGGGSASLPLNRIQVNLNLRPDRTYGWRVKAKDGLDTMVESAFTPCWTFTLTSQTPTIPAALTPSNEERYPASGASWVLPSTQSPLMATWRSWDPTTTASIEYNVRFYKNTTCSGSPFYQNDWSALVQTTDIPPRYKVSVPIRTAGGYSWLVQAKRRLSSDLPINNTCYPFLVTVSGSTTTQPPVATSTSSNQTTVAPTPVRQPVALTPQPPQPTTEPTPLPPTNLPPPEPVPMVVVTQQPVLGQNSIDYCSQRLVASNRACEGVITLAMDPECRSRNITSTQECDTFLRERSLPTTCGTDSGRPCEDTIIIDHKNELTCGTGSEESCIARARQDFMGFIAQGLERRETIVHTVASTTETSTTVGALALAFEDQGIERRTIPLASPSQAIELKTSRTTIDLSSNLFATVEVPYVIRFDADSDGLTDDLETIYKTDPNDRDSDKDGYDDGDEVKGDFDPAKPNTKLVKPLSDVERALVANVPLQQPLGRGTLDPRFSVTDVTIKEKITTMTGTAEPNSTVLLYVYSEMPLVLATRTDENGNWTYTLSESLTETPHTIYVAVTDATGTMVRKSRPLPFIVREAQAQTPDRYFAEEATVPATNTPSVRLYLIAGFGLMTLGLIITLLLVRKRSSSLA